MARTKKKGKHLNPQQPPQQVEMIDLTEDDGTEQPDILVEQADIMVEQNDSDFYVDTSITGNSPDALVEGHALNMNAVMSNIDVPDKPTRGRRSNGCCFNCDGDHNLNECPKPRDNRRISQSKQAFMGKRDSGRFHEHANDRPSLRPGVVSDSLRMALGIGPNDIPEWIFRMRRKGLVDGYPPGYIKRAVEKSVLPFLTDENSQMDESGDKEVIDPEKIIRYPGFNYEDRRLIDPDHFFKIPPLELFVKVHQETLDIRNATAREARNSSAMNRAQPMPSTSNSNGNGRAALNGPMAKRPRMTANAGAEDGEILDDSVVMAEPKEASAQQTPSSSTRELNKVEHGTPILLHDNGEKFDHALKPDLEKFSIGIQPFSNRDEPNMRSGFFTNMTAMLKERKAKK